MKPVIVCVADDDSETGLRHIPSWDWTPCSVQHVTSMERENRRTPKQARHRYLCICYRYGGDGYPTAAVTLTPTIHSVVHRVNRPIPCLFVTSRRWSLEKRLLSFEHPAVVINFPTWRCCSKSRLQRIVLYRSNFLKGYVHCACNGCMTRRRFLQILWSSIDIGMLVQWRDIGMSGFAHWNMDAIPRCLTHWERR